MIEKFPQLQGYKAFKVPLTVDAKSLIKCQLAIAALSCKPGSVFTSFIVVIDITAYHSRIMYHFFVISKCSNITAKGELTFHLGMFLLSIYFASHIIVIFYVAIEVGFCNLHSHKGCLRKFTF